MSTIKNYLSLIKFSHTIFAMPFALIGFFVGLFSLNIMAWNLPAELNRKEILLRSLTTEPMVIQFILILLCMVLARSAAMSFNRYLDRHFDAVNPRTAIREIPKGI